MARKIIWSNRAQNDRKTIFKYWNNRNKSNSYSKKLNKLFISAVEFVSANPLTGKTTTKENVRIKFISHYAIIYESTEFELKVYSIFDTRQNPNKLKTIIEKNK